MVWCLAMALAIISRLKYATRMKRCALLCIIFITIMVLSAMVLHGSVAMTQVLKMGLSIRQMLALMMLFSAPHPIMKVKMAVLVFNSNQSNCNFEVTNLIVKTMQQFAHATQTYATCITWPQATHLQVQQRPRLTPWGRFLFNISSTTENNWSNIFSRCEGNLQKWKLFFKNSF